MKVALCCIGRMENRYAVEFVEHYKEIGFDKIFVYDNNFGDEEHFEDVLQTYIDNGFIDIVDYRNKQVPQLQAYSDCYNKNYKKYDWIAFFDFDEYIHFTDDIDIKGFLSNGAFNEYQCIHINWMNYGDNNLVFYERKPLKERFKEPLSYDICMTYNFPENYHIKSIIRGGIENFVWKGNPHTPSMSLKCCDCDGVKCDNSPFKKYNYNKCYLKHYYTKTIDEWINHKYNRQYADRPHAKLDVNELIRKFFILNEKTEEKINFIENINKTNIFIGVYKAFQPKVNNPCYKMIVGNHDLSNKSDLKLIECGNKDDKLDDKFYSELYMLKYLSEKYELKDYVGYCHYRKYFNFLDNIPNMDEIFKEYDAIVAKPINYKLTIKEQYQTCHNIEDLYIIGGILADKYPSYATIWHNFINGNMMIPYNMFIMKKEDFKEYIKFIFDVLDEYINIVGTDIYKRIAGNNDKYIKSFSPNNTSEYQYRIGGYIGERLTNIFLMAHFKKMKPYEVIITEDKYK